MHRKVAGALVVAVMGATAAGCGGSSHLTKAEFVRKAEAVCTRLNQQQLALYQSLPKKANGTLDHATNERYVSQGRANQQHALAALRALNPPEELQTTFDQWQSALRAGYAMTGRVPANESAAAHARRTALGERIFRLEQKLDLRACR